MTSIGAQRGIRRVAPLVVATALLASLGVIGLRAVAPLGAAHQAMWWKQLVWLGLGLPLAVGAAVAGAERLKRVAYPLLGVTVAALLALLWIGTSLGGARRWLPVGPLLVQPAELAKVVVVLAIARYVGALPDGRPRSLAEYLIPLAILSAAIVPVFAQPNSAAVAVIFVAAGAVLLTVRWPRWTTGAVALAGGVAITIAWFRLMHAYQRARIMSFLRADDPLGGNYQTNELRLTIGSGGWLGAGPGSWVHAAPYPFYDAPMDAPFAVWAYERGLIGALALLGLHGTVVLLAGWIALRAHQRFDRSLATGLMAYWFAQVFLSVGSNLGLAPPLGVGLPLSSYGGSQVVASMLALGLLAGVVLRSPSPAQVVSPE